jgi:hypothetical protein
MGFFISTDTYTRKIKSPDGDEGEVTLRRLNAGDQAAIQDTLRMSLEEGADASLAIGTMRMLTVERALIKWDWEGPQPSPESISQLEPEVFEQIYSHVEIGTPPTPPKSAPQDGEASKAAPAVKKTGKPSPLKPVEAS